MLVQSKFKNEKIVLGLLSYTYDEPVTIDVLQQLVEDYREDDRKELLLFKDEETDNFVGIVGVVYDHEPSVATLLVERIALIPSFRHEGMGYDVYTALTRMYPNAVIIASLSTTDFVARCSQKYEAEMQQEGHA